ncbi:MAG: hypothetical protein GY859_25390 [Desulfobacterales bacterium]|nr:hypothetical protein [Desulfobacterales bacterium]
MGVLEDFSDSLANEMVAEMADGFFGRRADLEARIKRFHSYVDRFRAMEDRAASSAGFLNLLLPGRSAFQEFFKAIGAPDAGALLDCRPPKEIPLDEMPSAFTGRGRFFKLVIVGYDNLKAARDEYMDGVREKKRRKKDPDAIDLSYSLIKAMREVINKEVREINANISPTALLQTVRQFDVATVRKERALCADVGPGRLDKRLAFQEIDFDALGLTTYPELPGGDGVRAKIKSFCKSFYKANGRAIQSMFSDLKKRIQEEADALIS